MNKQKNYITYFSIAILIVAIAAFLCEYSFYQNEGKLEDKIEAKVQLYKDIADEVIHDLSVSNIEDEKSLTEKLLSYKNEIVFFIYRDDALIFWNSNQFSVDEIPIKNNNSWHYISYANVEGSCKYYQKGDFDILAFIPIKFNYPYANDYLKNGVVNHFHYSIDILYTLSFVLYVIAVLFLLFAYCFVNLHSVRKLKTYIWSSVVVLLIVGISYLLKIPKVFYYSYFFSEQQYAANQVVITLFEYSILSLLMLIFISVIYVNRLFSNQFFFLKRIVFYAFLLFFVGTFHAIVLRNNIDLSIASLKDFNVFVVWSWLILFVLTLTVMLFVQILKRDHQVSFKLSSLLLIDIGLIAFTSLIYQFQHPAFLYNFIIFQLLIISCFYAQTFILKDKDSLILSTVFVILIGAYLTLSSVRLSEHKKHIKYKLQAENILINGNAEKDPIAELLIEELDKSIRNDDNVREMHERSIGLDSMSNYFQKQYLHVFWNKYEVQIHAIDKYSVENQDYQNFLKSTAQKINQTNFYSLPSSLYNMSFIGWLDLSDAKSDDTYKNENLLYVFEFFPTKDFRSYSFPDLFANKETDVVRKMDISIAQYDDGKLSYHDNKAIWNIDAEVFNRQEDGFTKINLQGIDYYVLSSSTKQIVIRELSLFDMKNILFFSVFLLLVFVVLLRVLLWIFPIEELQQKRSLGFTAKFQFLFIILLIISFVTTLLFSVSYIKSNYEKEQIAYMESKKVYIQKSLQEMFYWTEDLSNIDHQNLTNSLQELAFRYQSDINIYDNDGVLQASTQPLVFTQNLISDLLSPEVLFSNEKIPYQYEHIGQLSYLASYTDLLNGDYLQLGYVSIPQYFSQTELSQKIDDFTAVFVRIYLIIILLAVFIVLIIGKRLAAPIHLLANKMKLMRLDGKNEKVEYSSKDEIGQLVEQYNRTVDELEKNTQLLLASERESAWRTMAKQVAHEINNPLTPMKLTIQQLQRTKDMHTEQFDTYFSKSTNLLIEQIDNLSRIASTFSQFAKLPEIQFEEFDLVSKLLSVIDLFRNNNESIEISYHFESKELYIVGDAEQLSQVFTNIMKNAVQSIPSNAQGKIDVLLSRAQGKISIAFKDNGVGISTDNQEDIFKPNFTTKNFGTGLGLSISKNIIENMGGKISFVSKEGKGTTFIIELIEKTTKIIT